MDNDIKEKCEQLANFKDNKKLIEDSLKVLNEQISELQTELVTLWQENDLTQVRYDGLGLFYIHKDVRARCLSEPILYEYLRENDQADMIKETIPHQTLSAWAKQSEMSKEELERLGLGIYEQFSVRIRK